MTRHETLTRFLSRPQLLTRFEATPWRSSSIALLALLGAHTLEFLPQVRARSFLAEGATSGRGVGSHPLAKSSRHRGSKLNESATITEKTGVR
jgi:hypothetical protein